MKTKILITGSTGDVGRYLKSYLAKKNYEILCLTREKKAGSQEVKGNLNDPFSLMNATKNIDLVIHLAASIKGNKKVVQETNVDGTKNLVDACVKNKVKKIIFVSSLDIKFKTHYGISKINSEKIVKKSKLKYVILRPSLIYGEEFKKGISPLIKILKRSPLMFIPGHGKNLYKPIYVRDLVLLIEQIIRKNKFNNNAYFVCGKTTISMNKLIDLICLNLKKKVIKIHLPFSILRKILNSPKIDNFLVDKIESNKKIKKDFEFNPIAIKEGIKKLI